MDKYACLKELWDCLYLEHPLEHADAIVGFGSHDQTTALRAARLYLEGWAPVILFTGYLGKGTLGVFPKPEAELFCDLAVREGVPRSAILVENKATNTGENIQFGKKLFAENGMLPQKMIAVHKPYMTRRVWASLRKQWPEVEVVVAPADPSLENYLQSMRRENVDEEEIINSLVGDFQRMDAFAGKGFQIPQEIPEKAWASFHELVRQGYGKYVV